MPSGALKIYELPHPRGVNTRTYKTEIPPDEYAMIKNFEWAADLGAFTSRRGTDAFNSNLPVASKPIRGGIRWYFGSTPTRELIVAAGTDLWFRQGPSFTDLASLKSGVTENRDWSFASYIEYLFICNGTDAMLRRDGPNSAIRAAGFPAPGTTATVATGAAGVLTGAYKYKITFVYDSKAAHESSASSASATVNPSAQQVDLSAIPTGGVGAGVTARNIYRTKVGGTEYFLVATINNNTTTIYSDNTADASLGADQAPEDNGIPPAAQFNIMWRGRHVAARTVANPHRAFFSSITSTEKSPGGGESLHGAGVEIFPADHFIDIGDDNSPITGLAVVNDLLVFFKEDQIWTLYGDDALDMQLFRAKSKVGCIAPKTIVHMPEGVFFVGRNDGVPGVFAFAGGSADEVSLPIEPTLKANIYKLGDTAGQAIQPCAGRYRGAYMLTYSTDGSAFETALLDTRPPRPRWLFMDGKIPASVWIPFNGPGETEGFMYYGHASEARVLRLDYSATDYDATTPTAVAGTIETGWLDLEYPLSLKELYWIDIYGKVGEPEIVCTTAPGDTTITITRMFDFDESVTTVYQGSAINVTTAKKSMDRKLWKHRVDCVGSDGTTPEIFYRVKLKITTSGPIEIHRIVFHHYVRPSEETHGQE